VDDGDARIAAEVSSQVVFDEVMADLVADDGPWYVFKCFPILEAIGTHQGFGVVVANDGGRRSGINHAATAAKKSGFGYFFHVLVSIKAQKYKLAVYDALLPENIGLRLIFASILAFAAAFAPPGIPRPISRPRRSTFSPRSAF
jgi:hypothetical protein